MTAEVSETDVEVDDEVVEVSNKLEDDVVEDSEEVKVEVEEDSETEVEVLEIEITVLLVAADDSVDVGTLEVIETSEVELELLIVVL